MAALPHRLIALAVVALVATGVVARAGASVLLVKGLAVLDGALPPLIPIPDGTVVAANDILLRSARIEFGADDILVYDVADGTAQRYGDATAVSISMLGMSFGAAMMIVDPHTLVFSPFANQSMSLDAVLDEPGALVIVETGSGSVPASVLSIGADDVHTPTPNGGPTRTATPTPTFGEPETPPPTATGAVPSATPSEPAGATATSSVTPTTPTPTATLETGQPCRGDCNSDGAVTIDELVRAVSIALGSGPLDGCGAADADHNGQVSIDELVAAVLNALQGCDA